MTILEHFWWKHSQKPLGVNVMTVKLICFIYCPLMVDSRSGILQLLDHEVDLVYTVVIQGFAYHVCINCIASFLCRTNQAPILWLTASGKSWMTCVSFQFCLWIKLVALTRYTVTYKPLPPYTDLLSSIFALEDQC